MSGLRVAVARGLACVILLAGLIFVIVFVSAILGNLRRCHHWSFRGLLLARWTGVPLERACDGDRVPYDLRRWWFCRTEAECAVEEHTPTLDKWEARESEENAE